MDSAIEKLGKTGKGMEIWWDSSPLIIDSWTQEIVSKEKEDRKAEVRGQLDRLYKKSNPSESVFLGVTTNPPLSLQVVKKQPEYWSKYIEELTKKHPNLDRKEIFWKLYTDIVKRGAEMFMPVFEKSQYKLGYLSGQVDPRILHNTAEMVQQGISLNRIYPNIMVKMPGTKEGIYGILLLTSLGIPTNATLTFTVSQLVAVAEAVKQGLSLARKNGVDLTKWRSVVTMMLGRMEDAKEFAKQAKDLKIELTETDLRWAGIAVFKKAYKIFKERKYESKLLAASMRLGPTIDGKQKVWHLEKFGGGDVVLTIFPNIIEAYLKNYEKEKVEDVIEEPVPKQVLDKLLKTTYFKQAYNEDGLKQEEYATFPAVVETATSFAQATDELENMIKK